jgi:hypothetical protein
MKGDPDSRIGLLPNWEKPANGIIFKIGIIINDELQTWGQAFEFKEIKDNLDNKELIKSLKTWLADTMKAAHKYNQKLPEEK